MKLTLRGSYHTYVISHTELASHKNQRLLLFLWESIGRVFYVSREAMKINSAEDAATNLHLINNTAHPKSKHTYCERASRGENFFQVSWIFWIFPPWIEWWNIWRCPLFAEVSALLTGKSVHDFVYIECIGASSVHQPHASPLSTLNPASSQSEFHN